MMWLLTGCVTPTYTEGDVDGLQTDLLDVHFSMQSATVVDIAVEVTTSVSYRHRPDCGVSVYTEMLNLGAEPATVSLYNVSTDDSTQIEIPVVNEGESRILQVTEYDIRCRDAQINFQLTSNDVEELLVRWYTVGSVSPKEFSVGPSGGRFGITTVSSIQQFSE